MEGSIGKKGAVMEALSSSKAVVIFFVLLAAGFVSVRWINPSSLLSIRTTSIFSSQPSQTLKHPLTKPKKPIPSLTCPSPQNHTSTNPHTCSSTVPITPPFPSPTSPPLPPSPSCPSYFRWIHQDLLPWTATGITREAVESAKSMANFRLVAVGGRVYLDRYHGAFQTRDVFTLWGFLQLLRRYPGTVPDFDLMFNCEDRPVVRADGYEGKLLPPLFRYCKDDTTVDIVFPDWSFWGWPEVNIKPWETLMEEIKEGNERVEWKDREPHAYWRGNPEVSESRQDLMKCNVSTTKDWNARLYVQDWVKEGEKGFKGSNLANQCTHRYKIYIEGKAWSVSEKYILACDSPTLLVNTRYRDFFSRGLVPGRHYLPIKENDKCRSIKSAVDWGNSHQNEAQAIGKAASSFIQEELKMDYVYDYMFHLLTEYSKLLRYKPSKPENAVELCIESMACPAKGRDKAYMMDSMVEDAHDSEPCSMPPPFQPEELKDFNRRKTISTAKLEKWE